MLKASCFRSHCRQTSSLRRLGPGRGFLFMNPAETDREPRILLTSECEAPPRSRRQRPYCAHSRRAERGHRCQAAIERAGRVAREERDAIDNRCAVLHRKARMRSACISILGGRCPWRRPPPCGRRIPPRPPWRPIAFSGRGGIPHRRYPRPWPREPASARCRVAAPGSADLVRGQGRRSQSG